MADPVPDQPEPQREPSERSLLTARNAGLAGVAGVIGAGVIAYAGGFLGLGGASVEEAVTPTQGAAADEPVFAAAQAGGPPPLPRAAPAPKHHADFIIMFEDAPEIEEAIKLYRRDQAAGRAAFRAWAANRPEFQGFEFRGGSYSGEAYLRKSFAGPPDPSTVQAALERLRALPAVAYCDPDFTAHPGAGE